MQNNILQIIFFPEIILTILALILLIVGLFQKENSFKNICNLSVISLILVFILIYINQEFTLLSYNYFFTNNSFIQYFKYLIVVGSAASIIISKKLLY